MIGDDRMTSWQCPTVNVESTETNPIGGTSTAAYQYDTNGRMSGMTMDNGYSGSQPFASATCTPAGQVSTLTCGPGTEQRTYNNPLQVVHQLLPGYMDTTYNYSATGG